MYPDMVEKMLSKNRNNRRWDAQSVGYCYKLLTKLGSNGYEFLTDLKWPLVSVRTLRERASNISFFPGPQDQFMEVLGRKVGQDPIGCLAVMSVDEMATRFVFILN
jgi:Transposase protein